MAFQERVDPELTAAILHSRCDNPAMRQTEAFCKYLQFCWSLNETEFYGALMACKVQVNVSPKHAEEMERTMLEWTARTRSHIAHPNMWTPVSEHFVSVA